MSKSGSSIMTLSSTVLMASHRPASKETDRSTPRGMHWFRLRPPEPPGRMHGAGMRSGKGPRPGCQLPHSITRKQEGQVGALVGALLAFLIGVFATLAQAQTAPVDVKVNFQPEALNGSTPVLSGGTPVPVPSGYIEDVGQGYDEARGYGWVRQDSLSSSTHDR